jgi:hypothetical protein
VCAIRYVYGGRGGGGAYVYDFVVRIYACVYARCALSVWQCAMLYCTLYTQLRYAILCGCAWVHYAILSDCEYVVSAALLLYVKILVLFKGGIGRTYDALVIC